MPARLRHGRLYPCLARSWARGSAPKRNPHHDNPRRGKMISSKVLLLALAILSTTLGTWGVFHPYSAPLQVREIRGSKVNPAAPYRNEQNILGGGDFATFMPDAFVSIRFVRPYAFTTIRHTYPFPEYAFTWLRVSSAEVQWSDDGLAWSVADTQSAFGNTIYFYVGASGPHEWWRFIITGSGGLPDLTLGNFWFDLADRRYEIPYDIAWGLLCAGILGLLFTFGALTIPIAFMVITIAAMTFVFSYALILAPYQIISTNDLFGYVQPLIYGTFDSLRNIGYPIFLQFMNPIFGLGNIAIVQVWMQLLSLMVVGAVVWRSYSVITGLIVVIGGVLFFSGWIVFSAPYILAESLITSGLLLATAGVIGAARHPSLGMFLLAGCGLLLATVVKSTGFAVTLATVPIVVWLLPPGRRVRGLALMAGPAVTAYLLMAADHYRREGEFAAQSGAGVLAGHVGWMLQGELPDHPGLIGKLKEVAAEAIADNNPANMKISTLSDLNYYVDYTSGLCDAILYKILPTLKKSYPDITWTQTNRILMRVAFRSIAADPLSYMKHVAAHFYGIWRQVGRAWMDLKSGTIGFRSAYELHFREGPFEALLGPAMTADEVRAAARTQATVKLAASEIPDYLAPRVRNWLSPSIQGWMQDWMTLRTFASLGLGAISIFVCLGILIRPFAAAYRAEIVLAFMLNAYMLSHVLVTWAAINRYPGPIIPIVFTFTVCLLHTSLKALHSRGIRQLENPS